MSKANEEAVVLAGVGGKVGLHSLEVNRFVPDKEEDSADVNGGAGKKLKGNFMAERRGGQVVENETDVLYGEEPGVFRGAGAIEDSVGDVFDILPTTLSKVLVLHESLALPVTDVKRSEDVLDAGTGFDSSMVTEEALRGTAFANVVLEGVGELFLCLHTVYVAHESGGAAEELTHDGTVIDGWGVRVEGIHGEVFVAPGHNDGWVGRLLMGMQAICVVASKVRRMVSTDCHRKCGRRAVKT
jgi:hypothetical protein